jgi:hypothetical protein
MSKEKSYDFTDLVLLVGTNPLPNYVVAKYFHVANTDMQRIWLFYSERSRFYAGTGQYADNIEGVLRKELIPRTPEVVKAPLSNISQANVILDQVKKHLMKRESDIKKIHLNYTGGTKAMAVHTYRVLENKLKACWRDNFSASYLDARDFNITIDQYPEKLTGDLRKLIQLKWEDLFALHNNEIKSIKNNYLYNIEISRQEAIMQSFAEMAARDKLLDFRSWVNTANRNNSQRENAPDKEKGLFNNPKDSISDKEVENIINIRLKAYTPDNNPELFDCLTTFPEADRFATKDGKWLYNNFVISGNSNNSSRLTEFLTGKWLEAYVAWVLSKKIDEYKIERSYVVANYELKTRKGRGSHQYEVDILVTNGYQICGISCGTALEYERGTQKIPAAIKTKGFEVILRSSQMGGDEARAILVTLLEARNAVSLENDLKASLGASGSRFMVLGIDDLKIERMWDKLEKHIYG